MPRFQNQRKLLGRNTGLVTVNYAVVKVPLDSPKVFSKTRRRLAKATILGFQF
jgi:hypothetical protein